MVKPVSLVELHFFRFKHALVIRESSPPVQCAMACCAHIATVLLLTTQHCYMHQKGSLTPYLLIQVTKSLWTHEVNSCKLCPWLRHYCILIATIAIRLPEIGDPLYWEYNVTSHCLIDMCYGRSGLTISSLACGLYSSNDLQLGGNGRDLLHYLKDCLQWT